MHCIQGVLSGRFLCFGTTSRLSYTSLKDLTKYLFSNIKLILEHVKENTKCLFFGWCLLIKKYFCMVYDYAGKADLSKGY